MNYNGIPEDILHIVLGECYDTGDYTLESELKRYNQDILYFEYELLDTRLRQFNAWTKDYVLVLVDSLLGDQAVLGIRRDPPGVI